MTERERSESELASLRRTANELAASRKERPTTVHLLAAVAAKRGPAADLLQDRGLDRDAVLKAGRTFDEELPDAMARALTDARDVSGRARGPVSTDGVERGRASISPDSKLAMMEPTALHLFVALLSERRFAAFRALALCGVDAVRLRTVALGAAIGLAPARREVGGTRASAAPETRERSIGIVGAPARPLPLRARNDVGSAKPTVVPLVPTQKSSPASDRGAPPSPSPSRGALGAPATAPPRNRALRRGPRPERAPLEPARAANPPGAPPPAPSAPPPAPAEPEIAEAPRSDRRPAPSLLAATALDPTAAAKTEIVCREEEIERVLDVLEKCTANAPCIVGPCGVGKTSLGLALRAPVEAHGKKLVAIAASALVAGTGARGALADRISALFDEARKAQPEVVLFVDDLHELLSSGDEAVAELKVQLARGDVRFVAATTTESLRRAIEGDPQLGRRLVPIEIDEPDEEAAFLMVKAAARGFEPRHRIAYDDDAIAAAVSWSIRYLPSRALPDKAIGALDYAGARKKRASLRVESKRSEAAPRVTITDLAQAMSELAGVPTARLLETDRERMLGLEKLLAARVVGHRAPLARIAGQLRKSAAGLRGRRPLGSFLLLGPTGVGKTETAKAIADALFGSADAMTRIDLSEYAESHALARLIGAPPGYVGHDAGGQLTEAVRKRPYQVILLDEVEKAHMDVLLAFLQVLDEGHLTDGRGRKVDFTNTVVACTSNLGSRDVATAVRGKSVGFARSAETASEKSLGDVAVLAAKKHLPLELFNRFDDVLFFAPLSRDEVASVARQALMDLAATLEGRGVRLELEDAVVERLLDLGGFDLELGARPMKRTIAKYIETPLAEMILKGELGRGSVALLGVEDGEIVLDALPPRERAQVVRTANA